MARTSGPLGAIKSFAASPGGAIKSLFTVSVWHEMLAGLLLIGFGALLYFTHATWWRNIGFGSLIAVPFAIVFIAAFSGRPMSVIRRWNLWIGAALIAMMLWGALCFFFTGAGALAEASVGGYMGGHILGAPHVGGGFRVAFLGILGLIFIAPSQAAWAVARASVAMGWLTHHGARYLFIGIKKAWGKFVFATIWTGDALKGWLDRRRGIAVPESLAQAPSGDGVAAAPTEGTEKQATVEAAEQKAKEAKPPKQKKQKLSASGELMEDGKDYLEKQADNGGWRLPSIKVLEHVASSSPSDSDNKSRAAAIEEAIASHGIEAKVVEISPGPAVTQFGLEPGWIRKYKEVRLRDEDGKLMVDEDGEPVVKREETSKVRVKVDAIAGLDKDLALALATPSLRIEAPIPGKALVGIEVPNSKSEVVGFRSILESAAFQKMRAKSKLAIALGKGTGGEPVVADLAKMPHVLVAGATGSGKSVCMNATIASILMYATPKDVRFLMVDPKRVELTPYNSIPHLVTPVIVDVDQVVSALKWALWEMSERYKKLAAVGVRNIEAYNRSKQVAEPMPFLVICIDELADLMMTAPMDVEHALTRLAQLGRATGIHLIVATQRPSVNVVTGLIKANFPTRIAFAVSSQVDSRTILDAVGAEKLLGKGDMLYQPQDAQKPARVQGVFVSDREIEKIVHAWNSQDDVPRPPDLFKDVTQMANSPNAQGSIAQHLDEDEGDDEEEGYNGLNNASPPPPPSKTVPVQASPGPGAVASGEDLLLAKARAIAGQGTRVSPSLLQKRLQVGYTKAKRLVEQLEREGYAVATEEVA
ncbi:MAG: DNA translocase FtsK [Chloroflexi bacterium]|nr:DNA translocase FtsK [Chloroflexota bacterium]